MAWWVWKLKLMLNSAPTELKLELGLSLAINKMIKVNFGELDEIGEIGKIHKIDEIGKMHKIDEICR